MKYVLLVVMLQQVLHANAQLIDRFKMMVFSIRTKDKKGNGFIVGEHGDSIYAITAKHVITNNNNEISDSIKIQTPASKVEFRGVVISTHQFDDVALIALPKYEFDWKGCCYISNIRTQADLFYFQFDSTWYMSMDQEGIVRKIDAQRGLLMVDIRGVEDGDSGSALFCADGLIGMILEKGSLSAVLDINRIRDIYIVEWKMPGWMLCKAPLPQK
jgi:hypothetical protein